MIKIVTYIGGVLLGASARLAATHKMETLTWKSILINSVTAFAAAFLVWHVLTLTGRQEIANACSVVTGRFADDVIRLIYKGIKAALKQTSNDLEETKP